MTDTVSVQLKREPDVLTSRRITGGIELDLRITADLASLTGHFPGFPIVPGVALIGWVVRFATHHLGFIDDGATQLQVKFRRVLQPDDDVTLTLHRLSERRVRFEYRHLDTVHSSGTISSAAI
jgi:3-hydroxymyristoyl/3-hydroxydecanoyl-(acyl carrier protein) dehydratase